MSDAVRPVFLFVDEAQLFVTPYDLEFMSTARSARAAVVYVTQNLPSLYAKIGGRHPQDQADAILGNFQTKVFHANTENRTNQWAADIIGKSPVFRANRSWSKGHSVQLGRSDGTSVSVQHGTSFGTSWSAGGGGSYSSQGYGTGSTNWSSNRGGQSGTSRSRTIGSTTSTSSSEGTSTSDGGGWSEQMDYVVQPSDFANRLRQGGARNGYIVSGVLVQANRKFSRTGACWTPVAFKQR